MKKIISLGVFSHVLLFLLCGCGSTLKQPNYVGSPADNTTHISPTVGSDSVTASSNATDSAAPTEATNTDGKQNGTGTDIDPNKPVILTPAEEFDQLIKDNEWYWRALGCTFAAPEEISLEYYFYNGVGDKTKETKEELDFIVDAYKKKNPGYNGQYNYIRMPAAKLNEGLAILGLTLDDVKIPDSWAYYDKLDTYYSWRTDAYGVIGTETTKVEIGEDGIIKVYWQTDKSLFNTSTNEHYPSGTKKMVMTLQEMPDGTLRVLSNLPEA